MKKNIVTVSEGIERVTETGVFRKMLLLPENVGIKAFEMGILMLHPGQGWGYPDHRHEDEEAYFVLEGKGLQIIDDEEFEIEKYMAIYMPSNSVHITKNTGNEPLWVLYVRTPEEYR
jgi:mannose-6-phosphate isomerase-like protein (cupin superfamily)